MQLHAYAKINLSLDVPGVLPDGYHEVRMLMQSIDIYDTLTLGKSDSDNIVLTCDDFTLPCDSSNLIVRAAQALMHRIGRNDGVEITLQKRIPKAAGLAGGSADAAAVLIGINELYGYGLDTDTLKSIGGKLGADIPFCIQGGTCLAEGIGDELTELTPLPECHIVLVKPPFDVSTAYVYGHLSMDDDTPRPDTSALLDAVKAGDLEALSRGMINVLENVTIAQHPEIADIKRQLTKLGALTALMSGSGPSTYGIFGEIEAAKNAMQGIQAYLNETGLTDSYVCVCHPERSGVTVLP